MKATPETRQRMLWAITAILSPIAFWIVFGLYEKLALAQSDPRGQSSRWFPSAEEQHRTQQLHDGLMREALQGNWKQVAQIADDTCGKECPGLIFPLQAEAYWHLGNRALSADLWSRMLDWESPVAQADLQALKGDRKAYVAFVTPLLRSPGGAPPNEAAWACVLLPEALPDYAPVVALAEKALQQAPSPGPDERGNVLNTLGVALYRAGRYGDAIQRLEESERLTKTKMNTIFLALSYSKLGQPGKARPLAESVYTYMQTSLGESNRFRPEYLFFAKELEATLPPQKAQKAQKATTQ